MSRSTIDNKAQCQKDQPVIEDKFNSNLIQIESNEYESIKTENKVLKSIVFNYFKQPEASIFDLKKDNKRRINNSKFDLGFYLKTIIGIFVIILALVFHILYLSVASCLFYTNGSSGCWIKSWFGMRVYASFFIDLTLYLLIGLQLLLILLMLKSKINELLAKRQ